MSSNRPRDAASIQRELNRQALVEMGKRLTEIEQKCLSLEEEAKDLKYFSLSSLERAKRLQGIVKSLIDQRKARESQGKSEDDD